MIEDTSNRWTPFKGGVIGFTLAFVLSTLVSASCETESTVPKRMRLNEPCHYGAKPMMVENEEKYHVVVCGCPQ